eukprot:gene16779-18474_t
MPCWPCKKKQPKDPSHPNRPDSNLLMQQKMSHCELEISASTLLPILLCLGVIFIPLGIVFLTASAKVLETTVEYTKCKQFSCDAAYKLASNTGKKCCSVTFDLKKEFVGQVYMFYQLENFYQNHRLFARSKDDEQLRGNLRTKLSATCAEPYRSRNVSTGQHSSAIKSIAPCGAIANSIFNDIDVTMSSKGLTWTKEKGHKFANPPLKGGATNSSLKFAYSEFASPPNWPKPLYELKPYEEDDNANLNSALIIWMRSAAFPTFRKLFRKVQHTGAHFSKGLPKGNYRMDIQYSILFFTK